jgi:hypothetical protein
MSVFSFRAGSIFVPITKEIRWHHLTMAQTLFGTRRQELEWRN